MQAQHTTDSPTIHATHPEIPQRPIYLTVNQFSERNPAFSASALRNLIFKAYPRISTKGTIAGNGMIECGAIVRVGRKILIVESRLFDWIESKQSSACSK